MTKIQILNETQVQHFYSLIQPKLAKEFELLLNAKTEEVKANKSKFLTHENVLKTRTERSERLAKIEKVVGIIATLKELKTSIKLSEQRWQGDILIDAESYVEDKSTFMEAFDKETERQVDDKLYNLSYIDSKMSEYYSNRYAMESELKARLCMVAVTDADTIENKMLQEIKVESFFTV